MAAGAICFALQLFAIIFFQTESIAALRANLYQWDSYGSPFYDPSLTRDEIIYRSIVRSYNKTVRITPNSPVSEVINYGPEYFMKIHLGTPPVEIIGLIDTGSSLTWIQCQPCLHCFQQPTAPFNPMASSTYASIPCVADNQCPPEPLSHCVQGLCRYEINYADGSYSRGFVSKETMRMDSTEVNQIVEVPSYTFGCGTDNVMTAASSGFALIGFGRGADSIITQLGPQANGKFSYCLEPSGLPGRVSHIRFGDDATFDRPQLATIIPMADRAPYDHYFLTLNAITVGSTRIPFNGASGTVEQGNIIIDSGSALTTLPWPFYTQILNEVILQSGDLPMPDPAGVFDLCFLRDDWLQLPKITVNFNGGDLPLKRYNSYVRLDTLECLGFRGDDTLSIYGSYIQHDYIVVHDLILKTVGFRNFECDRY